jgi:hypothetical protein
MSIDRPLPKGVNASNPDAEISRQVTGNSHTEASRGIQGAHRPHPNDAIEGLSRHGRYVAARKSPCVGQQDAPSGAAVCSSWPRIPIFHAEPICREELQRLCLELNRVKEVRRRMLCALNRATKPLRRAASQLAEEARRIAVWRWVKQNRLLPDNISSHAALRARCRLLHEVIEFTRVCPQKHEVYVNGAPMRDDELRQLLNVFWREGEGWWGSSESEQRSRSGSKSRRKRRRKRKSKEARARALKEAAFRTWRESLDRLELRALTSPRHAIEGDTFAKMVNSVWRAMRGLPGTCRPEAPVHIGSFAEVQAALDTAIRWCEKAAICDAGPRPAGADSWSPNVQPAGALHGAQRDAEAQPRTTADRSAELDADLYQGIGLEVRTPQVGGTTDHYQQDSLPADRTALDGAAEMPAAGSGPQQGESLAGRATGCSRGTVNQRMLEHLHREPASAYWTQRQWADFLSCQASAVAKTHAWRTAKAARALAAVDRLDRPRVQPPQ